MDLFVFFVLAFIAIASAFGMLFSRNAIYSALFLVLNFVTVAVFYLLLGAPFIACRRSPCMRARSWSCSSS